MTPHSTPSPSLTLEDAARMLTGRGGRRPHVESVRRWAVRGCKLPTGEVVRLKTAKIGGTRLTALEWVEAFSRQRLLAGLAV